MSENKFCKHCGKEISEDFKLCPYCGKKVEEEILEIPCQFCGKTIKSDFKVCPYCGNNPNNKKENYNTENRANNYSNNYEISNKSGVACLVLLIFLGGLGGLRFYAGKIASAFGMLILTVFNLFLYFLLLFLNSDLFLDLDYLIDYINSSDINLIIISIIMVIINAAIFGLWWIIDLILIVIGKFKDSKGRYIKLRN